MPSPGRRLARRYLPPAVRRAAIRVSGDRLAASNGGRTTPAKGAGSSRDARQDDLFVSALRRGGSLADAAVSAARHQVGAGQSAVAVAVATALSRHDDTSAVGDLVGGLVAFRRGYPELAWSLLQPLPPELWAAHAPEEFLRSGLDVDPGQTVDRVRRLAADRPAYVTAEGWLALIGPVFAHGDLDLARDLFAALDTVLNDDPDPDPGLVVNRDWLRPWVAADGDSRTADPVAADEVSFAIMDYGHPGRARASANIGDHVQSLAALGPRVRPPRRALAGPQDLVDLVHQLHARVRPERQLTDVEAKVRLLAVDRDASEFSAIPQDTWTLAFGWFMHAIFDTRYGFPFHPNLLPIFISFHCSKRELLTEEAIEYLRRYAPIGCRDWTTVDVLLSVGVPAFFSGCMTTTVSAVFPDTPEKPGPDAQVAYVDVPPEKVPAGAPTYKHSDDSIRFRSFAANMYDAIELLETYRRRHSGLVTSRLHCYLPGRSIGVPVDFQPGNRSDPRFAGLIDITETEFDRIRETVTDKLRTVLTAAFSGQSPDEVYELWREINAADVEAARRRHEAPASMSAPKVDLVAEAARVREAAEVPAAAEDRVHVAVHVPAGRQQALEVLLASLAERSSRPVQVFALTRRPRSVDAAALRAAVPGVEVTVVSTKGLGSDLRRGDGSKPAPRDVDLLALPALLPDVRRLVLLPADALVLGDVAELADLDLEGSLLAAPTVVGRRGASGFGLLHAAGGRLRDRTAASAELRRQGHQRHRFDFDAFETDVLVLDLAAARERSLVETYVPYVEEFGLSFREILLLETGPHRAVLPERWHVVPDRSAERDPALVHWADAGKPWADDVVTDEELWLEAAARLRSGSA
jgi:hypothetical protein